jgi:RsiW-degrading membrane proteinase PrsW (M82 family)
VAKDTLAGKRVKCPACGQRLLIPTLEEIAAQALLNEAPAEVERPASAPIPFAPEPEPPPERKRPKVKAPAVSSARAYADVPAAPPSGRRPWHWLLVLALIPLGFSLLGADENGRDVETRLFETVRKAPADVQARVERIVESKDGTLDDLLTALPNQRLEGAHLPRDTWVHWLYAGLAALVFAGLLLLLCSSGDVDPRGLAGIALFTGTIGILFLLVVQFIAEATQHWWVTGRSVLVIVFYLAKLIGFSYRAALDPDTNFVLSFLGFTLGVGFCEEVCKALPLLVHYRGRPTLNWRGALLWGLASGVGFGIAEGIMYASDYYNGVSTAGIYVVRFVSCVALHAIWSASVGLTLDNRQEWMQREMSWFEFIPPVVAIVGIPMVLHGLYDTLLKKEMNALALAVAVVSFGWLAWQVARRGSTEAEMPVVLKRA